VLTELRSLQLDDTELTYLDTVLLLSHGPLCMFAAWLCLTLSDINVKCPSKKTSKHLSEVRFRNSSLNDSIALLQSIGALTTIM